MVALHSLDHGLWISLGRARRFPFHGPEIVLLKALIATSLELGLRSCIHADNRLRTDFADGSATAKSNRSPKQIE